jgi:hypothetical protein
MENHQETKMKTKKFVLSLAVIATLFLSALSIPNVSATTPDYYVTGYDQSGSPPQNCNNPGNIIGSSNDQQYANLFTDNNYNMGYIVCFFNDYASGDIVINAYSASGYTSLLLVYVWYDGQYGWNQVYGDYVTSNTPTDVYIGCLSSAIDAMTICVYNNGDEANLYIDSVLGYDSSGFHYYLASAGYGTSGSGAVYDVDNVTGAYNDGYYACLVAENSYDSASIYGAVSEDWLAGTFVLRVYSESGYNSHITVSVTDGIPIYPYGILYYYDVYDGYVSSSTPIDLNFYSGNFRALRITVDNPGDSPSMLYIDTVFVYP